MPTNVGPRTWQERRFEASWLKLIDGSPTKKYLQTGREKICFAFYDEATSLKASELAPPSLAISLILLVVVVLLVSMELVNLFYCQCRRNRYLDVR